MWGWNTGLREDDITGIISSISAEDSKMQLPRMQSPLQQACLGKMLRLEKFTMR